MQLHVDGTGSRGKLLGIVPTEAAPDQYDDNGSEIARENQHSSLTVKRQRDALKKQLGAGTAIVIGLFTLTLTVLSITKRNQRQYANELIERICPGYERGQPVVVTSEIVDWNAFTRALTVANVENLTFKDVSTRTLRLNTIPNGIETLTVTFSNHSDAFTDRDVDISDISHLSGLQVLALRDVHVTNVGEFAELHQLKTLDLSGTDIDSVESLKSLDELSVLNVSDTKHLSLIEFEDHPKKLTMLIGHRSEIASVTLTGLNDLSAVEFPKCVSLQRVQLNELKSLTFLEFNSTKIESLTLNNLPLRELLFTVNGSASWIHLVQLPNLRVVQIAENTSLCVLAIENCPKLTIEKLRPPRLSLPPSLTLYFIGPAIGQSQCEQLSDWLGVDVKNEKWIRNEITVREGK